MDRDLAMEGKFSLAELQELLENLHNLAYLESHPLAERLGGSAAAGNPLQRGRRLQAFLIGLIKELQPKEELPAWAPEERRYLILHERYVRRRPLYEIEDKLSLGDRQVRREHRQALAALAVLVQASLAAPGEPASAAVLDAVKRLTPMPRTFPLAPLLEEVVAILARLNKAPGLVTWRVSPDHLTVCTDRGVLHQLLLKLLRLTFPRRSEHGPLYLRALAENDRVVVSIAGWTSPIQTDEGDLRLCQGLARTLGADLTVIEGGQEGYQLCFALAPGDHPRRVLIIDDEPLAIELFTSYVSGLDYQVIGENVAEQALRRAIEVRPEVIVLDVIMPGMDGWELLQRLRHAPELQDVPIIACSVLDDQELAAALGAACFLKKPVLRQQFIAALAEVCQPSR